MPHKQDSPMNVHYTPPRVGVPGATAAAIMRQSSASQAAAAAMYGAARSAGVVTPLAGSSKPWMNAMHHGTLLPSLESRNKSTDSTDRSTGNASHMDDTRSVATLATESDDREATASALLMVAKAAEREHLNGMLFAAQTGDDASSPSNGSSAMPLKKRMKQLNSIMRRQQDEDDSVSESAQVASNTKEINTSNTATSGDTAADHDPCHVSPVSHSSAEHGMVGGRTESTEDSTPPRRRMMPPNSANRTSSYDSKDLPQTYRGMVKEESTQELLDSAKVHSTSQIGAGALPSQVLIPHFPTVLHQVLADKEFDGKVVQWLPDGEAWKVLRWDALRRQILPRYFADLRDENGGGCGTIDAFLFHLSAWGFEEIKDGTDVGAYRHDLFIRGAQKLCVKMRFTADSNEDNMPKAVSPHRSRPGDTERSMLQVPSLADSQMPHPPNKRPRYDVPSPVQGPLHWHYGEPPSVWGGQYASEYGMRAATAAAMSGQYLTGDPRMQVRRSNTPENLMRQTPTPQYSPPQVRSGRGALRVVAAGGNRATSASSPSTIPMVRQGISVSNRGKGPRKPAAIRPSVAGTSPPASDVSVSHREGCTSPSRLPADRSSPQTVSAALCEAHRVGSSVQNVAVAISRKTKRKLPMSSKKTENDVDDASDCKNTEDNTAEVAGEVADAAQPSS